MDMEEEKGDGDDEIYDANTDTKPNKASIPLLAEDVDTDAEAEVLNELNLLTEIEESPPGSIHLEMNSSKGYSKFAITAASVSNIIASAIEDGCCWNNKSYILGAQKSSEL
ncbi:uncharacterized protein LOC112589434 [Harpegnathos saltator]|uniref:uncharacterized protein LOC112589434 n=1 Tax=Harpegnathos saltator TaxID=610380 RepID=UPI000DBED4FD|nr:uncharacterized protein LOC112589434 [Harpegnathos saltator]